MKKIILSLLFLFFSSVFFGQNASDIDPTFNQFNLPLNHFFYNHSDVRNVTKLDEGEYLVVYNNMKLIKIVNNVIDTNFNPNFEIQSINFSGEFIGESSNYLCFKKLSNNKILARLNFKINGTSTFSHGAIRLNENGTIDTTFSLNENIYPPFELDSNGNIISWTFSSNNKVKLVKYNSNGIFLNDITTEMEYYHPYYIDTNVYSDVSNIKVLPDNKIVCVLHCNNILGGQYFKQSYVKIFDEFGVCLNSNKHLEINSVQGNLIINNILFDSNSLYLAGAFKGVTSLNNDNTTEQFPEISQILKLNLNGTVDPAFTGTIPLETNSEPNLIYNIVKADNNKLLILGNFSRYKNLNNGTITNDINGMLSIDSNGTILDVFNSNKIIRKSVTTDTNSFMSSIGFVFNNQNKLDLFGDFYIYQKNAVDNFMQLNNDFTLNTNINNFRKGFNGVVKNIAFQNDGKILAIGKFTKYNDSTCGYGLTRLLANGDIDPSFNYINNSINNLPANSVNLHNVFSNKITLNDGGDIYSYIHVTSNNQIYVNFENNLITTSIYPTSGAIPYSRLMRLNLDGSRDTSFITDLNSVKKIKETSNKLLVLSGSKLNLLSLNGAADINFRNNVNSIMSSYTYNFIENFELTSNSKILILYYNVLSSKTYVKRLNIDGTLDNSFTTIMEYGSSNNFEITNSEEILIKNGNSTIVKYNSNGVLDTNFNTTYDIKNFELQLDNKIIIVNTSNTIKRLNANGSLDNSFNPVTITSDKVHSEYIDDLNTGQNYINLNLKVEQHDTGKLYIKGYYNTVNNFNAFPLVKLIGNNYNLYQGGIKYDSSINGCDLTDPNFNQLKFNINNTNGDFTYYCNSNGLFKFALPDGTNTITPILFNTSYFNVNPISTNLVTPNAINPFIQDYCVTPNGNNPDLEVSIIPVNTAIPGFNALYKIVYKNNGTQTLSGAINFSYNDNLMDFVQENPASNSNTFGNRIWNFSNLSPLETREILVTYNLNSPTDNPSLNAGAVLNYSTNISHNLTDITPLNNSFNLNQPVVNSYDPNDKICLDGSVVGLDKVGEYVYYRIRFENTGTYKATNINVLDVLDTNKFDINTLIPVNGSHLFTTKITEGNKVEFYFENINLDFQDATNEGYLVYKIKTKSNLVAGDTFGGNANIYFDYNYPITTNIYTTVIQALSAQDFEIENYFDLYPNPVDSTLNISKKSSINITSIEIYNIYGQVIQAIPNARDLTSIDVSNLAVGTYFIKINSELGSANAKFIKK
jgi:uncharacterized delta-60 repeat protein